VNDKTLRRSNQRLVWRMVVIATTMFVFGFAVAPYYDSLCTYLGITPKGPTEGVAEKDFVVDMSREIALSFVTTVNGNMPLDFRPETPSIRVHPGQYYTVKFYAKNLSAQTVIGQAIPSIAPVWAAGQLKKTECFCFSEQRFEPNVEKEMPVRLVIDPSVSDDVRDMTLSYTFFDITQQKLQ